MPDAKSFTLILSGFACDKGCPYCTAKITVWDPGEDRLDRLDAHLHRLTDLGYHFDEFILSGNGEPGLYERGDLLHIADRVRLHGDLFGARRLQTGGNLFLDPDKWSLFYDWDFKITRCSPDDHEDREWLRYANAHAMTDEFAMSRVTINHVLLRQTLPRLFQDLDEYIRRFPNLMGINLTILNLNTRSFDLSSRYSRWILDHGVLKEDADAVLALVAARMPMLAPYNERSERYTFDYNGMPVYFYARKSQYGRADVVFYRGDLVDFQLNPLNL